MSIIPPLLYDKESEAQHWRAEVSAELRHISESVTALTKTVEDFREEVGEKLEQHRQYHRQAEPYWGPVKWCQRHPFRVATLAATSAALASAHIDPHWLQMLIPAILQAGW